MLSDNTDRSGYIDRFVDVHSCRNAIQALGIHTHPLFENVFRPQSASGHWTTQVTRLVWVWLEKIVYRQELSLKYQNMTFAKKFNDREHKKAMAEGGRRAAPIGEVPS